MFNPLFILIQNLAISSEETGYFVLIAFLLLLSGLISGSEVAFLSLRPADKDELKKDNSKTAEMTRDLIQKPQELLATILIANNFLNFGIVISLSKFINEAIPFDDGNWWHFFAKILVITFIIVLFGEVMPKVYATKNRLVFAKLMTRPLVAIGALPPFSWLKSFLVKGTKIIRKYAHKKGVKLSSNELEQAIALTTGVATTEEEQKMLEDIIRFGNIEVRQIMKSRMDVVSLEHDANYDVVLETILDGGYSRIPVSKESFDEVIGVLYIKDLLPYTTEKSDFKWQELLRQPFYVPENKKIDDLLKDFQEKKNHMAIVVDEYGGSSGIVTLEDVLEEIVGDITEEFDEHKLSYEQINETTYLFEGRTALIDMYKVLEIDGREFEAQKGDSDSIGGFLVEKAGKILKNKELFLFENIKFIVESSDKKRIKSVKIIVLESNK
ncbi:MAG: gliding motility-associated protein GldE [Crocinitomicaceae bacterium]|nr:gliding motility-associated protein GldE [Crocinitomicaceae bacterium]